MIRKNMAKQKKNKKRINIKNIIWHILEICVILGIFWIFTYVDKKDIIKSIAVVVLVGGLTLLAYFTFIFLKRYLYLHSSLGKIDAMDGVQFEYYLSEKLAQFGYETELTKANNDFGADLIIQKEGGPKIAVQAKRWSEKVNNSAVQEVVASLKYYGCDMGMVITNSIFTENATILAEVNDVVLWNRGKLKEYLVDEKWDGEVKLDLSRLEQSVADATMLEE